MNSENTGRVLIKFPDNLAWSPCLSYQNTMGSLFLPHKGLQYFEVLYLTHRIAKIPPFLTVEAHSTLQLTQGGKHAISMPLLTLRGFSAGHHAHPRSQQRTTHF